jgi:hypothetical protein
MSPEWTSDEIKTAITEIRRRATTDLDFRQRCFTDPAAAIQEVAGRELPEGMVIRFVDNQGANATIVLPDPVDAEGELSDEELEQVAGGSRCAATCLVSCAITTTATYGDDAGDGVVCL